MVRFHLTPVRITTFKNIKTNVGEGMGRKELSYTAGRKLN
jgi:hypothetical protein